MAVIHIEVNSDERDELRRLANAFNTLANGDGSTAQQTGSDTNHALEVGRKAHAELERILDEQKEKGTGGPMAEPGEPAPDFAQTPAPAEEPTEKDAATTFGGKPATETPDTASVDPDPSGNGEELDADGRPWDERIDSGAKTKNKTDGRWKARRNVDPDYRAQVLAEYQGGGPAVGTEQPAPAAAPEQHAPAAAPTQPAPAQPAPPPAAEQPEPAAAASEGLDHSTVTTLAQVMPRLTKAMQAGAVDQQWVNSTLAGLEVQSVAQLASSPDKMPRFSELLEAKAGV